MVSVIMNCFNCSAYLKEAVGSVFAQTYKNWEIIFWDDGSCDGSLGIAKNYGERIKCFKGVKAKALGQARNSAIEQAKGEYIAFLDCDDVWMPQKLERQVLALQKDPKTGLVFCDVIYFDNKGDVFQAFAGKKPPEGEAFGRLLKKNFLCVSSVMVKKEALLSLGEWFDRRFTGIEDWDLFLRIAHGWKLSYVDLPLAKYRMHQNSWTSNNQHAFFKEKELMVKKLVSLYPDIAEDYGRELKIMRIKTFCKKIILRFLPFSLYAFLLRAFKIKTYSS